jgi:hypothetical protein
MARVSCQAAYWKRDHHLKGADMTRYGSDSTEEPGQYPTQAWSDFGLPEQNFGSGAPGGSPQSGEQDLGSSNEPGQYPSRETFTGVALGGTGAPGSQGIPRGGESSGGADTIVASKTTFYKSEFEDPSSFSGPDGAGYAEITARADVSGPHDWTGANEESYGSGWNMPGVEGNTPAPGSGQFQTGAGSVRYGGMLNGQRPGTTRHPSHSGPGT